MKGNDTISSHSFELISFPSNQGSRKELPNGPRAYVGLRFISKLKYLSKDGVIELNVITPESVTFQEFEWHVDNLIKELEQMKKIEAKGFFEKELARKGQVNKRSGM